MTNDMKDQSWTFQFDGELEKRNMGDGRIRMLGKRAMEQSWIPQLTRSLGKNSYDSLKQINGPITYISFLF